MGLTYVFTPPGTQPQTQESLILASQWSTELGSSQNAALDGDIWDAYKGSAEGTVIVTTSSLGFASPGFANCMKIGSWNNSSEGVRMTTLPIPASGTKQWRRFYFAMIAPPPDVYIDTQWHPFDMRKNTTDEWGSQVHIMPNFTAQTFNIDVTCRNDAGLGDGEGQFVLGEQNAEIDLDFNVWYGFEWEYTIVSSTLFRVSNAWVYDVNGNVLYDSEDWYQDTNGGLSIPEASAVNWTYQQGGFTWWQMGSNGFVTGEAEADMWVIGAVAISDQEQIGPWNGTY